MEQSALLCHLLLVVLRWRCDLPAVAALYPGGSFCNLYCHVCCGEHLEWAPMLTSQVFDHNIVTGFEVRKRLVSWGRKYVLHRSVELQQNRGLARLQHVIITRVGFREWPVCRSHSLIMWSPKEDFKRTEISPCSLSFSCTLGQSAVPLFMTDLFLHSIWQVLLLLCHFLFPQLAHLLGSRSSVVLSLCLETVQVV